MSGDGLGQSYRGSIALIGWAAFVVVCAGVKLASPVLVPVVLGAFIATVNFPLVFWLYRRRLPLPLSIASALLADTVMVALLSWLMVVSAAQLSDRLPIYLSRLRQLQAQASGLLHAYGVEGKLQELLEPGSVVGAMASLAGDVAVALTELLLAVTIAGFLLFRFGRASAGTASAPMTHSERVRRAVREMYRYIALKTLTSIGTGLLVGGWLALVDADLPISLGLLAFFFNYVPTLGAVVATGAGILVALLHGGPEHVALVAAGYAVINVGVGNVVEPRVMGRALGLWPLVVLVSVVFWGWLLGVVGALLSALLTQTVRLALLATPDLRAIGLLLGPAPAAVPNRASQADLVEEAMPASIRRKPSA